MSDDFFFTTLQDLLLIMSQANQKGVAEVEDLLWETTSPSIAFQFCPGIIYNRNYCHKNTRIYLSEVLIQFDGQREFCLTVCDRSTGLESTKKQQWEAKWLEVGIQHLGHSGPRTGVIFRSIPFIVHRYLF